MNKHEDMSFDKAVIGGTSTMPIDPFDEAIFWSRPGLSRHNRHIAATMAAIMQRMEAPIERAVSRAVDEGFPAKALTEICVHSMLYAGTVTSEMSLHIAKVVLDSRGIAIQVDPLPSVVTDEHRRKGAEIKAALHGERREVGHANPHARFAPALYQIATDIGYGHIWARGGLSLQERLICAIAAFTVQEDAEASFCKFAQAGQEHGLSVVEIQEVVIQTTPYVGFPRALKALILMEDLF
ncbi:MAG: carboxymuconolactone decarboxylase family protein [Pseudomonadota bacterium]